MSGSSLVAYYGGSGMWSIKSRDGKRAYSVTVSGRGKTKITNRRGDVLKADGPTAKEIARAMKAYTAAQSALADQARKG